MEMGNEEERRLQTKLNECALTFIEKKNVLDARDKLLRLKQDRQTDLSKAVALVGTCPDMCPEQERYFRIETNQVSSFEMDFSNNSEGVPDETRMVKEYRRSGADQEEPLPHELRPIDVLEYTMNYLCLEIVDRYDTHSNTGEWFDFIWSRTRSIRKDITQQHLVDLKSVTLIEKCARFHIFCSYYLCEEEIKDFDPKINEENLNNCLQTLKDFYYDLSIRSIYCPNEPEFRAYDILLNLGDGKTLSELKHFKTDVKNSPDVLLSIKLYQSYDSKNHVKFFKYARQADFFKSCILNRYFNSFRIQALNIQRKAYTVPKSSILVPYPVQEIINILAFDDFQELSHFCDYVGLKYDDESIYFQRTFIIENVNLKKRSKNLVNGKLCSSPGQAILGLKNGDSKHFRILPVHSSFDSNNKLIYDKNNFQINNHPTNVISSYHSVNDSAKPKENTTDSHFTKAIQNTFENYNITSFSFKTQFDKLAQPDNSFSQEKQFETCKPTSEDTNTFASFKFDIQNSNLAITQNEIPKIQETAKMDNSKTINQLKFDIFDSLLKENIQEICHRTLRQMLFYKQIIAEESNMIMNMMFTKVTKETINKIYFQQKQIKCLLLKSSNHIFQSILLKVIESIIHKIYSDIKLKRLHDNILSFSIHFYDEIFTKILRSLARKILMYEIESRDDRIKTWRNYFLRRKYWFKWRKYNLFRKRYKFYRDTFPAAPACKIARLDRCPNLFLNNSTFIDDNFIKVNDSLKRKLTYSRYDDITEMNRFIAQNLKNKLNSNKRKLTLLSGIELIERVHYLERKYFKLWLKKTRRAKNDRIRSEFPSAPLIMNSSSKRRSTFDLHDDKNYSTIIDPLIVNADDSIKSNLLQKLNYDFDSTVTLIKKTLDDRRRQRQQRIVHHDESNLFRL